MACDFPNLELPQSCPVGCVDPGVPGSALVVFHNSISVLLVLLIWGTHSEITMFRIHVALGILCPLPRRNGVQGTVSFDTWRAPLMSSPSVMGKIMHVFWVSL